MLVFPSAFSALREYFVPPAMAAPLVSACPACTGVQRQFVKYGVGFQQCSKCASADGNGAAAEIKRTEEATMKVRFCKAALGSEDRFSKRAEVDADLRNAIQWISERPSEKVKLQQQYALSVCYAHWTAG